MAAHGAHLNRVKSGFTTRVVAARSNTHGYVRDRDDFYATPARAMQALLKAEKFTGPIWEPACGDGAIARPLTEAGYEVIATDLVDRGFGKSRVDFLMEHEGLAPNIVTNPPFKLAVPFVRNALRLTTAKVAMLLKLAFLEGKERAHLFANSPLARVHVFSERIAFVKPGGGIIDGGGMMCFAWFIWDHAHEGPPRLGWL